MIAQGKGCEAELLYSKLLQHSQTQTHGNKLGSDPTLPLRLCASGAHISISWKFSLVLEYLTLGTQVSCRLGCDADFLCDYGQVVLKASKNYSKAEELFRFFNLFPPPSFLQGI